PQQQRLVCRVLFSLSMYRLSSSGLKYAQARELSHLRQRLREGRGVCSILTQHLGDTTKAFEELLRANDIDYYMGQSFRDQLAQGGALAQRVSAKISGRECFTSCHVQPRYYKGFTDSVIRYVNAKDEWSVEQTRTPPSTTSLSDRGFSSFPDCHSHSGAMSHHASSVPPSITSSHSTQPCLSCPSMRCPSSPQKPADMQSQTGRNGLLSQLLNRVSVLGSDLMKEHLREIRSLRQRLEDSIQTNDRLRQQLEDRLAHSASEKGNKHTHTHKNSFSINTAN
uniref:Myomegalin n=1 Tax=Cyclopterus lumpus TaxID=8103 RepID=A0A8C2XCT8_CYCLU